MGRESWLDVDPAGLAGLADRMTGVAERLAAVEWPDSGELPATAGPDGRPLREAATRWLDELPRTASELRELAGIVRQVAGSVRTVDEEMAAQLTRLFRDVSDGR
ncbi:hypothetical protein ACGFJ5_22805 [Micromonospora echinaurantiaca]|uniref:hypothetical protein n=1 Tax=Micromonospora echinaurantiaca TaxID=47857 RepID=UPI003723CCBA